VIAFPSSFCDSIVSGVKSAARNSVVFIVSVFIASMTSSMIASLVFNQIRIASAKLLSFNGVGIASTNWLAIGT
jgi:hypothetical protein